MEDVSKISFSRLLGTLTTGQVIGIASFLVMLATSGFSLGYWLASAAERTRHEETKLALLRAEDTVERRDATIEMLQADIARLREDQAFLQIKAHVLGLIVQLDHVRSRVDAGDEEPGLMEQYDQYADTLFRFVIDMARESAQGRAETEVRMRLGKGIWPTLTFERDGSTWPLPKNVFATAD